MPKTPNMTKDTRTKPAKEDKRTRNTPKPSKKGWQGNVKQNTTNQGYQQDR